MLLREFFFFICIGEEFENFPIGDAIDYEQANACQL